MKMISDNLRNYLLSLATLILCACAYDEAARRLLAIPEFEVVKPKPPTKDESLREELSDLFPEDAWQLADCKRLITSHGTLLFQDWRQISDEQWKLEPLTIVIGRGLAQDDAAAPIVLTADEGAEVQFSKGLDLTGGGSAPPIKMGRMIGDVQIKRGGQVAEHEKLHVNTRDVRIDNQKVWTTEPIAMEIGDAKIRGRDLTIYLAASATTATSTNTPSTILDRMDLVYLDEFLLPLDGNSTSADQTDSDRLGGVISVACNNRVSYDFALDRLSLHDQVSLVRTIAGKIIDRFDCDSLEMVLLDPSNQRLMRRGPLDWIDRIRATGHPAVVNLASQGFALEAETIDFDSMKGLLEATSGEGVRVTRHDVSAHLRKLTYQYDPALPTDLGAIDVMGAGNVVINNPEFSVRRLTWTDSFKLHPLGQANIEQMRVSGNDVKFELRIDGNVRARLTDGGTAQAGAMEAILKSSPTVVTNSSRSDRDDVSASGRMSLVPEVFHATKDVSIDTSQIAVTTNQLSLYFERAADFGRRIAKAASPAASSVDVVKQPGAGSIANATGAFGNLVGFATPVTNQSDLRQPIARPRPELSGDLISAKLLVSGQGIEPKDISINGDVSVKHQIPSTDGVIPIEMSGQTMRLIRAGISQSSGRDYLQLGSGPNAPARLTMDDGFFIGPTIKVWPNENTIEVEGSGELKVPSSVLTRKLSEPGDASDRASEMRWTSNPYCRWGKAMTFDGSRATLHGGVQIEASLMNADQPWRQRMTGNQMVISLSSPVQLMDRKSLAAGRSSTDHGTSIIS